jgi:hypothetical protein
MFYLGCGGEVGVMAALDTYPDDVAGRPDEWIEATFGELQRIRAALETKRLTYLAALERAGVHRRDGHVSTAAWIADRYGESAGAAKREVRTATALEQAPIVRDALRSGEVPISAVGILVEAREAHPEAFDRAARDLVEQATSVSADELRRVVAEWSQSVDEAEGGELDRLARMRERRSLSVCAVPSGMVRVTGELDPETGEPVVTALRAIVDAGLRGRGSVGDSRTVGQRYADALGELAERYLSSSDRASVAGERPTVTVMIDAGALVGDDGLGRLDHAGAVPARVARMLACDAGIQRVVLSPRSEPLDVGRRTPVVPPAIRRALIARDDGCTFPGCERPPRWADAHHVRHWTNGGVTAISNLVLLCREHHRVIHEGMFAVRMAGGTPVFTRPDGTVMRDRTARRPRPP